MSPRHTHGSTGSSHPPPDPEAWRSLRVGDRIRIVRMPSGPEGPGSDLQPCTQRLYRKLIQRRRSVRVSEIDEWELPWIQCRFKAGNGTWEHHCLAVNDDSWVRVRPRRADPA